MEQALQGRVHGPQAARAQGAFRHCSQMQDWNFGWSEGLDSAIPVGHFKDVL